MRIILILLSVVIIFSACAPKGDIPLTYADGAFECELSWSVGEVKIRGVLLCEARVEGEQRNISLRISEPDALAGALIKRSGGEITITVGGVEFCDADISGLLKIESLIDCRGEVVGSTLETFDGNRVNRVVLTDESGGRREIYLDSKSGYPIAVRGTMCGEELEVRVIYFSAR